jgi:hypothetical protein
LWTFSGSLKGGIAKTDGAVHEWLGLFVYWVSGRIPILFPRPPTVRSKMGLAGPIGTINDFYSIKRAAVDFAGFFAGGRLPIFAFAFEIINHFNILPLAKLSH